MLLGHVLPSLHLCSSKTPQMCNFLAQLDVARASLIVCSSMLSKIVLLCSELDDSQARQSLYSSRLSSSVRLLPTMISCKYQTPLTFKSTIALAVQESISRNYVVFKLAPNLENHLSPYSSWFFFLMQEKSALNWWSSTPMTLPCCRSCSNTRCYPWKVSLTTFCCFTLAHNINGRFEVFPSLCWWFHSLEMGVLSSKDITGFQCVQSLES